MVNLDTPESSKTENTQALCIELKAVFKTFGDPPPHRLNLLGRRKYQGKQEVLAGLDLKLPYYNDSKFVVLLGPSGCGKSTVLNLVSGLLHPDAGPKMGEVLICGKPLTGPNDLAATVPQAYTCFPWLSVIDNVELGMKLCGTPRNGKERRKKAIEYLEKVGLEDRLHARPKQLSGGMQQRVAIARTLVLKPQIVLMDEPFGALDAQTRAEMQKMLLKLWAEEQNLIIFVTHDINEALLLADEVIVFPKRPVEEIKEDRIFNLKEELSDAERGSGRQRSRDSGHPEFARLAGVLREKLKCDEEGEPARLAPPVAIAQEAGVAAVQSGTARA